MSEFKHIDDVIFEDNDITVKSRNKLIYLVIILAAFSIAVLSIQLSGGSGFRYALFFIAIVLAAIGVVGAAKPGKCIYYTPTGEKVREHVFYFDSEDKKAVCKAVRSGEFANLKLITSKSQGNMMAVIYATPSLKYYASQMQAYVPHEYVPVEEVVIGNISLD